MGLIFNIFRYYVSCEFVTYAPDKVSITPKRNIPQLLPQVRQLLKYFAGRYTLQYLHHLGWRVSRQHLQNEKDLLRQAPLSRLAASRFPPASLLAGIQREVL